MITDLINGLKKHEIFRSQITSYFPDSFEKLRMRALAQKALREGYSRKIIIQTLLKDPDFEKITNQQSPRRMFKNDFRNSGNCS